MTSLFGVDVSHYQTVTPTKGLSFLIAKATEGVGFADPMYSVHVGRAQSAGLRVGAYHFCRNDVGIDLQALFFVQHAAGATALVADVEGPHALSKAQTRVFIAAVKKHDSLHRPVGLYMSESVFYRDVAADFRWVANWSHTPSIAWDLHQYDSTPYDQDVAKDERTLDRIFGAPPGGHTLHIAHDAVVVTMTLGTTGNPRCIATVNGEYGVEHRWTGPNSKAPCGAPVSRRTCDGRSHATTVRVTAGAFAGKHVRVDPPGVTVT